MRAQSHSIRARVQRLSCVYTFLVVHLIGFSSRSLATAHDQYDCVTPTGDFGICSPIKDCAPIWDQVIRAPRPLPKEFVSYLQSFHCGGFSDDLPNVCCLENPTKNIAAQTNINMSPILVEVDGSYKESSTGSPLPTPSLSLGNIAYASSISVGPVSVEVISTSNVPTSIATSYVLTKPALTVGNTPLNNTVSPTPTLVDIDATSTAQHRPSVSAVVDNATYYYPHNITGNPELIEDGGTNSLLVEPITPVLNATSAQPNIIFGQSLAGVEPTSTEAPTATSFIITIPSLSHVNASSASLVVTVSPTVKDVEATNTESSTGASSVIITNPSLVNASSATPVVIASPTVIDVEATKTESYPGISLIVPKPDLNLLSAQPDLTEFKSTSTELPPLAPSYVITKPDTSFVYESHAQSNITVSKTSIEEANPLFDIRFGVDSSEYNIANHSNLHLLPLDTCGPIQAQRIISNGNGTTDLFDYPWMVLLQYALPDGTLAFRCGGSLINNRYVLTAAHCVTDSMPVSVRLGEYDLSTDRDCQQFDDDDEDCADPVQDIPVARLIVHPGYNRSRGSTNDIALIRLSAVPTMSDSVRPICLPVTNEIQNDLPNRMIIAGWGTTGNQKTSQQQFQATLPVITNAECQLLFRRSIRIQNTQMCAGGMRGINSCNGDSGGPLMWAATVKSVQMVQFGITSHCSSDNPFPSIYVRVAPYMPWILDNLHV